MGTQILHADVTDPDVEFDEHVEDEKWDEETDDYLWKPEGDEDEDME